MLDIFDTFETHWEGEGPNAQHDTDGSPAPPPVLALEDGKVFDVDDDDAVEPNCSPTHPPLAATDPYSEPVTPRPSTSPAVSPALSPPLSSGSDGRAELLARLEEIKQPG